MRSSSVDSPLDTNPVVVSSSSSSSNDESCWEEKSGTGVDDANSDGDGASDRGSSSRDVAMKTAVGTSLPPVIFAGVSSPGQAPITRRRRLSLTGSLGRVRAEAAASRHHRRRQYMASASGTSRPNALADGNAVTADTLGTTTAPIVPSALPLLKRPSVTNRPPLFSTASSCRAELQRRSRSSAKLRDQVLELEAALGHSKSKETALVKNIKDLKERIHQQNGRLDDRDKIIETLEHEHRCVKRHFRELMESTLDSSSCRDSNSLDAYHEESQPQPQHGDDVEIYVGKVEDESYCRDKRREGPECVEKEASTVIDVDDLENDVEMIGSQQEGPRSTASGPGSSMFVGAPQLRGRQTVTVSTWSGSTPRRFTEAASAASRSHSVPPRTERVATTVRDEDLLCRLRETEGLLESLRGTNGYAQQVLKRNSILESRCDELENLRDNQLREVYDELHNCKAQLIDSAAMSQRQRNEINDSRQEIADLHAELQKLHERMRQYQDMSLELRERKEELLDAQDALNRRDVDAQRVASEWEAERQYLLRNIELQERLLAAKGKSSKDDTSMLRDRNAQLEELLAATRVQSSLKINEMESELEELRNQVRSLTGKSDRDTCALAEQRERNAELENTMTHLRAQLESLRADLCRTRQEGAKFSVQAAEVQELKDQLKIERERCNNQMIQISNHVGTIKESNTRFAELIERTNVLDTLLQRLQKEKEDYLNENIKGNSKLYIQVENYRKKWDAASIEVQTLKKQLSDHAEKLRLAVERERVEKDRELRHLRDEFAAQRLALHRNADQEIVKLRAQFSQEMTELRRTRDTKVESVVKQYETYLTELKTVHEREIKDLNDAKDKGDARTQEEIKQCLSETQVLWKQRLVEGKIRHEKEIQALTASYQENLQNELKKKSEEVEALRRALDEGHKELKRVQLMSERRLQDEKIQREQIAERITTETQDASAAATIKEKERSRLALLSLQTEHAKSIKALEDAHAQMAQSLNRKVAVITEKLNGAVAENENLIATINARDGALSHGRSEIAKAVEAVEAERKKEVAAAVKEQDELKAHLEEARQTINQLKGGVSNDEEIKRLNERIEALAMTNTELESKFKQERNLLKGHLDAKSERLNALLTENQYTKSILKRNSELEAAAAKETKENDVALQRLRERTAALELENVNLKNSIAAADTETRHVRTGMEEKQRTIDRLSKRLEEMGARLSYLRDVEDKIKALTSEITILRRQLDSSNEAPDNDSEANRRYRDMLREMGEDLSESTAKCARLEEEVAYMKGSVEEVSKLTLELQHMKSRLESQDEMVGLLQQRWRSKETIIADLKEQLNALIENRNNSDPDPEEENKLEMLAKKCQDLSDLRHIFEQERRTLEHRMELERQILTQKNDQKDRQLELLLETNRRAELCFARNVELEEALLRLTNELEELHRKEEQPNAKGSTVEASSFSVSTTTEISVREAKLREELEGMMNSLMQKDGEIRLLQTRSHEMKARHKQELEELSSRLKFASIEQSLNATLGLDEDSLLQALIDKVGHLQEEVKRLRKGRDAQLITLQLENESLKAAPTSTPARDSNSEGGRKTRQSLEFQIDTLEIERDALRSRLSELIEALRVSSSLEASEVEALKQRNIVLQTTVDKLTNVVNEQKRTLDLANQYADKALKQNGSLRELTGQLDLPFYNDHVLESILKRNLELESLLRELQKQNNVVGRFRVSRSYTSKVTTPNADPTNTDQTSAATASTTDPSSDQAEYQKTPKPPLLNTTPSTSSGEVESRPSPSSPALLCPKTNSIFTLTELEEHQAHHSHPSLFDLPGDTRPLLAPSLSLYQSIRSSVSQENDGMESEGRARCKRPRLSQGPRSVRYTLRSRSKTTTSLPASSSAEDQNTTGNDN